MNKLHVLYEKLKALDSKRVRAAVKADRLEEYVIRTNKRMMQMIRKFLSRNEGMLRDVRGDVKQALVADAADVTQPMVSWVENGKYASVSLEALLRMLEVYATLESLHDGGPDTVREGSSVPNEPGPRDG